MKCNNCGEDNPNNSSFCSSCGSPLESSDFDVLGTESTGGNEDPFADMTFGSVESPQGGMQQGGNTQGQGNFNQSADNGFDNMTFGSSDPNIKRPKNYGVGFLVVLKVLGKLVKFAIPITIIVAIVWFFNFAKSVEESKRAYEEATGTEWDDSDDGYVYEDAVEDVDTQYVSVGETVTIYDNFDETMEVGKVTVKSVDLVPELLFDGSTVTVLQVDYEVETTADSTLFYGESYFEAYDEEGDYIFNTLSNSMYQSNPESEYLYLGDTASTASGVLYYELEEDMDVVDIFYWNGTDCAWRVNLSEIM